MDRTSIRKLKELLKKSREIVIITHSNPDGDAMGSSLGLHHFLKSIGKRSKVLIPNAYPGFLGWLPGVSGVLDYAADAARTEKALGKADLIFTLDFNALKRIDRLGDLVGSHGAPKVLIDHHPGPEKYATVNFHDPKACSTAELVYRVIEGLGEAKRIDRKIAACLYTGLMTDSGSFRYSCVRSSTHEVVAALLETGIAPSDIHSAVYDDYSVDRMRLLGYALSEKLTIVKGLPAAYIALSEEELRRFNFRKGDTEGLVNYPFMIRGIRVCALFTGAPDFIKVSLRSKGKADVNKYARAHFNGGGHINAAGGRSHQTLEQTVQTFIETVQSVF